MLTYSLVTLLAVLAVAFGQVDHPTELDRWTAADTTDQQGRLIPPIPFTLRGPSVVWDSVKQEDTAIERCMRASWVFTKGPDVVSCRMCPETPCRYVLTGYRVVQPAGKLKSVVAVKGKKTGHDAADDAATDENIRLDVQPDGSFIMIDNHQKALTGTSQL